MDCHRGFRRSLDRDSQNRDSGSSQSRLLDPMVVFDKALLSPWARQSRRTPVSEVFHQRVTRVIPTRQRAQGGYRKASRQRRKVGPCPVVRGRFAAPPSGHSASLRPLRTSAAVSLTWGWPKVGSLPPALAWSRNPLRPVDEELSQSRQNPARRPLMPHSRITGPGLNKARAAPKPDQG